MKFDAKFSQPKTVLKPSFGGTIYTVPSGGSCVDCVKSVNGVLPDANGNVTIQGENSSEETTQVLAKAVPRVTTVILDVGKWVENGTYYSQTLELDNITQYSRLDLQPDATMIEDMRTLGVIFVTENTNGKITVQSIGNKPSKTYTIQATTVEIKPEIEPDRILGMPVGTAAISPKISVNKEDKITTLTITDIEGTKTVMINDGADGKSGVHIGEEEPAGNEVVWVDPNGEPDVFVKTVNGEKPDENGNVDIEVSGEAGGETIVWEEEVLASGTIAPESTINIDTGITLTELKRFKSFLIRLRGTENKTLSNLYFSLGNGRAQNTITLSRTGAAGVMAWFVFGDTAKTKLYVRGAQVTNPSVVNNVGTKFAQGVSQLSTFENLGATAMYRAINLVSADDSYTMRLSCATTPTISYDWEIRGITK